MMYTDKDKINILVTLDENYIPHLNTMLFSLIRKNQNCLFDVYLLHSSIEDSALSSTGKILDGHGRLIPIQADDSMLANAPTTDRYPKEIYYRIFAAQYLPKTIDKVLYLDLDIIVNGSITSLYKTPMEDYYFAAASHIKTLLRKINGKRLDMDDESPYINSGVMLMNLKLLREKQDLEDVFHFIEEYRNQLLLPDQDIISSLYGTKILLLDSFRYNMTERLYRMHAPFEKELTLEWIRENSVIIHYCGRNKPWKPNYVGKLNVFYHETVAQMNP